MKEKIFFGLNIDILSNVKVQSIINVKIYAIVSNKLSGDVIRLCVVSVCVNTNDEMLETIFSRQELHYDEFILEGEVESSDDKNECNEKKCDDKIERNENISILHNCLCLRNSILKSFINIV